MKHIVTMIIAAGVTLTLTQASAEEVSPGSRLGRQAFLVDTNQEAYTDPSGRLQLRPLHTHGSPIRNEYLRTQAPANSVAADKSFLEIPLSASDGTDGILKTTIMSAPHAHIKSFVTTWTVPELPANPDALKTLFLWNGLDGGGLQPVLEYNNGSGREWHLRNWANTGKQYVYGPKSAAALPPGTKVTGRVTFESVDADGWHYTVSFDGYPELDLHVVRPYEASSVVVCFEPYTHENLDWPANDVTAFEGITLTTSDVEPPSDLIWSTDQPDDHLVGNGGMEVISASSQNGEIDFHYR